MTTCRTCKHWQTKFTSNYREYDARADTGCNWPCAKLGDQVVIELVHGYSDGYAHVESIDTPADFGCNMHEVIGG